VRNHGVILRIQGTWKDTITKLFVRFGPLEILTIACSPLLFFVTTGIERTYMSPPPLSYQSSPNFILDNTTTQSFKAYNPASSSPATTPHPLLTSISSE
jgi:hypothetical protein